MTKKIVRVEPISTYLERWKAPTSVVTRTHDTVYVSGLSFVNVPAWPGHFDIEIDCIAAR